MITLASDFGSPYPAAMKGVVLRRTDARLVDVAHDLPRQDVRAGAFWCRETLPYFPPAVHLVVVDPGVGTDRDAIVIRAGEHALVGPDNGVLLPAARRIAEESGADGGSDPASIECFTYDYDDPASSTFHGRDVFAPAAAAVHEVGVGAVESLDALSPVESVAIGESTDSVVDCRFPDADVSADEARGEVLVVDDFGNVITNIPGSFLDGREAERSEASEEASGEAAIREAERSEASKERAGAKGHASREAETVAVNGERAPVVRAFADVPKGERLVTVGSHGFVECDVNRGRGDEAFGLAPGDDVIVSA